ncbi:MAG TPA: agmatinase [Nitrospirae bacterium]|nr:N(1)-aminopropylagmatine ureohydrolase [bacterium BMS3Bbin09]HDO67263.1 agmatinase [Nitrospirota bacterium]HEW81437.1 agmatinase [Nitrospirota bacterium]
MKSFAGIEEKYTNFDLSSVLLQSIPYDGTSTWGKGEDKAFDAFIDASENMELYDIETDSEVYKKGICVLPEITEHSSPESVFAKVYNKTKELLNTNNFLTFFGGEHSISIGIIKAYYEKYSDLTVLQLDAHADLRESYLGSKYNHACALHDASKNTNLVQLGIRSMDISEKQYLNKKKCFFAEDMYDKNEWQEQSLKLITEDVYLTIDLDVFDPSIMPATGTPEPGGLNWNTTINYLKKVFKEKNVVGFDIVELAPIENNKAPNFLAAKLYYKLLSYKFKYNEK